MCEQFCIIDRQQDDRWNCIDDILAYSVMLHTKVGEKAA